MKIVSSRLVKPKPPYNFDLSVRNPSYYPVPTNDWTHGALWFTMRWKERSYGIRFVDSGSVASPAVKVSVYGRRKMGHDESDALLGELGYRFDWNTDYSPFYETGRRDALLAPVIKRLRGMRDFCAESFYELLMISILLQNATVKRTEAMTRAMLEKYGNKISFDGQQLYCFWTPERLLASNESELRALKVGYRAKSFLEATQDCSRLVEEEMRRMNDEDLRKTLLEVHGVGPATADVLMQGSFHRGSALNAVPPWECKIFSRLLFKRPMVDSKRVQAELVKRYGAWRGLAAHYLFMDLCWRHKEQPIEWFSRLMPY